MEENRRKLKETYKGQWKLLRNEILKQYRFAVGWEGVGKGKEIRR